MFRRIFRMGTRFSRGRQEKQTDDVQSTDDQVEEVVTSNRKITDKFFLAILASYITLCICLFLYVLNYSDVNRILNGYDDCGNVCGRKNNPVNNINCSGKDMRKYQYLFIERENRICVKDCGKNYTVIFNRCFEINRKMNMSKMDEESMLADLRVYGCDILLLCILTFVYSMIMAFLFRFATKCIAWFMLSVYVGGLVFLSVTLWIIVGKYSDAKTNTIPLAGAIISTIAACVLTVVFVVLRKRINFGIQLIQEAAKAIATMPQLLFVPVLTSIAVIVNILICSAIFIVILSSGILQKISMNHYDYVGSNVHLISLIMLIFLAFWMVYFITDCQNMVISGCVARWFFTRDKSKLHRPITSSLRTTFKFHLGTIAVGSLIINICVMIKALLNSVVERTRQSSFLPGSILSCFLNFLETLLQYITRNCYVITSIYGFSFCKSGKRAYHIIKNNLFKIVIIQSLGSIVFIMVKLFIVVVTITLGYVLFVNARSFLPHVIVIIFSFSICHMFLTVYEMTIETIFVCFCEDYEKNDGDLKPYYMSKELLNIVEETHKFLDKTNNRNDVRSDVQPNHPTV